MSKDDFVNEYRHKLGGMVLDAMTNNLHGRELSVRVRMILDDVDRILLEMFARLNNIPLPEPPKPPQTLGPNNKPSQGKPHENHQSRTPGKVSI